MAKFPYIAQGAGSQERLRILNACIQAHVPVGFVGNPGVGKTATIAALAEATGRELIDLSLSTMPPEDVSGLPFPTQIEVGEQDENGNRKKVHAARYAMPIWQQKLLNNPHSILFLDEFSTAIPTTQHAFLQLVQDRRLPGSDEPFSDDVAIIIAMNPADQAGGSALDLPIANRFAWFTFDMDFHDWKEGFLMGWKSDTSMPIAGIEPVDDETHATRVRNTRNIIANYFGSSNGSKILSVIPTGSEKPTSSVIREDDPASMEVFRLAFMTPRSIENMASIISNLEPDDLSTIQKVINGTIGSQQGLKFYQYYMNHYKGIDIDAILKDPKKTNWKKMTIDDSTGVFIGLMEAAKSGKFEQVMNVYIEIKKQGALELLSGNRIQDLFKAEYMPKNPKKRKELMELYRKEFGSFLRQVGRN